MKFKKTIKPETRKLGRMLVGSILAAGMMLPKPARADSIELMAGNKSATIDLKASAEVAKRLGVFIRARPSVDYTGTISSFALADLTINLGGGLDAVGEVQAFGGKAVPRAGMQYFTKTGNLSVYALATMGLDKNPYVESLAILGYDPSLYKILKLFTQIEVLNDADAGGNVFSAQRMRLGVELKGWGAGAAADLTQTGHNPSFGDGTFGWNVGGFMSKRF